MPETSVDTKDFRQWRQSGRQGGFSLSIGRAFCAWRDAIARGLVFVGVTPNLVTFAGFLATCGAGVCLAFGAGHVAPWDASRSSAPASWWPLYGALFVFLSGAFDMLDGAVARVGNLGSPFGAVWDSTLDRCSDLALFAGCAAYFAAAGNVTYVMLAVLAASAALLTSYIKARAENLIDKCDVGYWQRGERVAAVLIAASAGHLPTMLWMLALSPSFTVIRRIKYVHERMSGDGQPWKLDGVLRQLMPWRHPRGSIGYDVVTGSYILILIVGPWVWPFLYGQTDPLGDILRGH